MNQSAKLPLEGVRVIDVGSLIAGPFGATLLGDFGAEVIKVEQPGIGDALRGSPVDGKANRSGNWLVEGRNKKSVTLNLRLPEGQAVLKELVAVSDVLMENFTPGAMERWNLGWDELSKVNPRLIMARVSGYGQTGPNSKRSGYDRIALGFSGYMYPTGFPDRFPVRPAFPTADYTTGMYGALSVMMALYQRDMQGGADGKGGGQMIDLALYEACFRFTGEMVTKFFENGEVRERIGNRNPTFAPAGTFETKDGRYVQIAAGGDGVFRRLTVAMGKPDLAEDPRYRTSADRIQRPDELEGILADWVKTQEYAEIDALMAKNNVPFGGILTVAELAKDPHYAARENIVEAPDPGLGKVPMPSVGPKFSATPGRVAHAGPELGAHNDEILEGLLGKSADEIADLKAKGVV